MSIVYLILYILAAVCFLVAASGRSVHPRVHLVGLGLFFWVLVPLIIQAKHM